LTRILILLHQTTDVVTAATVRGSPPARRTTGARSCRDPTTSAATSFQHTASIENDMVEIH